MNYFTTTLPLDTIKAKFEGIISNFNEVGIATYKNGDLLIAIENPDLYKFLLNDTAFIEKQMSQMELFTLITGNDISLYSGNGALFGF